MAPALRVELTQATTTSAHGTLSLRIRRRPVSQTADFSAAPYLMRLWIRFLCLPKNVLEDDTGSMATDSE